MSCSYYLEHSKAWRIGNEMAVVDIRSKGDVNRSKISDVHSVFFLFQGSLTIDIRGKNCVFQANQVVNIMSAFDYTIVDASADIIAEQVLYTDTYIKDVFKKGPPFPMEYIGRLMAQPELNMSKDQMDMFARHFKGLECILQRCQHHFYQEKVKCAIWMLMMDLGDITYQVFEQQSVEEDSNTKKILLCRFMSLLPDHVHRERTVAYYADALCVTPQYLERIVKALSKHSVKEWIQNTLIAKVNERLLSSNDSIQSLTSAFGFVDQPTFTKYYRRYMGITPTQYRKKAMI